jgi:hypothetical protein
MSNLEPIDDADLDLKNKFMGGENSVAGETPKSPEVLPSGQEIKTSEALENLVAKPAEVREERSAEKEKTYSKILSKIKPTQNTSQNSDMDVEKDAADSAAGETAEAKIDKLVKLAMVKGVVHAVKVAKHLDDNYTLDEFHDKMMAEEFHKALMEKGLIMEL